MDTPNQSFLAWALHAITFALGAFLGSLISRYDRNLTLRTNIVGLLLDRVSLIPTNPIASEEEAAIAVQDARKRWQHVLPACKTLGMIHEKKTIIKWTSFKARDGTTIRGLLVKPHRKREKKAKAPFPVVVMCHGGGFAFGIVDAFEPMARRIALDVGAVVIVVEYRLAPENKYPIPLHDVQDAILWASSRPQELLEFGGDTHVGLAVMGDSAGGNLATVATVALKGKVHIQLQVLIYPVTLLTPESSYTSSAVRLHSAFVLPQRSLVLCKWQYLTNVETQQDDPHVSPLLFKEDDLKGVAPVFLVTGGADPLHTQGVNYKEKLQNAGVTVGHAHFDGEIHGFMSVNLTQHYEAGFKAVANALKGAFEEKPIDRHPYHHHDCQVIDDDVV